MSHRRVIAGHRYGGVNQKGQGPTEDGGFAREVGGSFDAKAPEAQSFLGTTSARHSELSIEWRPSEGNEILRVSLQDVERVFLETRETLDRHSVWLYRNFIGAVENDLADSDAEQVVIRVVAWGNLPGSSGTTFIRFKAVGRLFVLPKSFITVLRKIRSA